MYQFMGLTRVVADIGISAKFFSCMVMDSDKVISAINTQNTTRPISRHLGEQAWSIKDSLYGNGSSHNNNKFARKSQAIPSGQDRTILPAHVANHNTGLTSFCLLRQAYLVYANPKGIVFSCFDQKLGMFLAPGMSMIC